MGVGRFDVYTVKIPDLAGKCGDGVLRSVQSDGNDVDFKSILLREGLGVMIIEGYLANSSSYLRQIIQLFTDVNIMDISVYLFGIISAISILMGVASPSRKMIHDHIAKTHIISTKEEQV